MKHTLPWMTIAALLACGSALAAPAQPAQDGGPLPSSGVYRLPYADRTRVSVFDDAQTHRPVTRVDLVGEPRSARVHRIVAAAAGTVMAIEDSHLAQQSGRAAAQCRNNFVWIAHPNGEWTLYSHMRTGTSSGKAGLKPGQRVRAGQYLGDEASVGCAMLPHLHFEVAVPAADTPIDAQGFLTDNAGSLRNRIPRFCLPRGTTVKKDTIHIARACHR